MKKCEEYNIEISKTFMAGKSIPEIGNILSGFYFDYLMSGKVHVVLLRGNDAILKVKNICGATFPSEASENSIRGMFGTDNFKICIDEMRAARNIIHAPESIQEATFQMRVWFPHLKA